MTRDEELEDMFEGLSYEEVEAVVARLVAAANASIMMMDLAFEEMERRGYE